MMDRVNVFVVTTAKNPAPQKAAGVFIIERIHEGIPLTKEGYLYRESTTGLDLTIQLLCNAIYILSKLNLEYEYINIATKEQLLDSAFNQKWIDKWIAADWVTAKGNPVAHTEHWKKLVELLEGLSHRYIFSNHNTSYFNIMTRWAEEYLKAHATE